MPGGDTAGASQANPDTKDAAARPPAPTDQMVETKHVVVIDGQEIRYTVTTGTIVLKEEAEKKGEQAGESEGEKPKASVFFIAYTRDDVEDKTAPPAHLLLQRRPGLFLGLAAPGRARPAPRADGRRRQALPAALPSGG